MIVVTGADGFIGTHLCRALKERGHTVYGIDLQRGLDIMTCLLPDAERVYHLAAQTDAYCKDASADARTNILGALRVFERYTDRVVFSSSAMVNYPVNPYAISKKACEDYARYFGCAVVRFCNIHGPGGHSFMDKCAEVDEITIYGSGHQMRTWQHVDVAVRELLLARAGELRIVDGTVLSLRQIAARFAKPVRYLPDRAGDLLCALQQP